VHAFNQDSLVDNIVRCCAHDRGMLHEPSIVNFLGKGALLLGSLNNLIKAFVVEGNVVVSRRLSEDLNLLAFLLLSLSVNDFDRFFLSEELK